MTVRVGRCATVANSRVWNVAVCAVALDSTVSLICHPKFVALLATIVVTSTDMPVPNWFGWLLVASFLGGFGYLVVTMPRDRDDPWDDGARL